MSSTGPNKAQYLTRSDLGWFDIGTYEELHRVDPVQAIFAIGLRQLIARELKKAKSLAEHWAKSRQPASVDEHLENIPLRRAESSFLQIKQDPLLHGFSALYAAVTRSCSPSSVIADPAIDNDFFQMIDGRNWRPILVDVRAPDKLLLQDFKREVAKLRSRSQAKVTNKSLSEKLKRWSHSRVLALIDLDLFCQHLQLTRTSHPSSIPVRIKESLRCELLYPDYSASLREPRLETARNHATEILNSEHLIRTLLLGLLHPDQGK